jgi:hypothetical protein
VVTKGEDVLGHPSSVVHMVGAYSNLGQGPKVVDYKAKTMMHTQEKE